MYSFPNFKPVCCFISGHILDSTKTYCSLSNLILFTFVQHWKITPLSSCLTVFFFNLSDSPLIWFIATSFITLSPRLHTLKLATSYDSVLSPLLYILCLAGHASESPGSFYSTLPPIPYDMYVEYAFLKCSQVSYRLTVLLYLRVYF